MHYLLSRSTVQSPQGGNLEISLYTSPSAFTRYTYFSINRQKGPMDRGTAVFVWWQIGPHVQLIIHVIYTQKCNYRYYV